MPENEASKKKKVLELLLQMGDIRAIDIVLLLLDMEVAHKASIRGIFNGDQTVAIPNLGRN